MGEEIHTRDFVSCIDLLNLLQDFLPESNLKFRQLVDDKGRYYYWNKASGTVSYSRPEGFYTSKQLAKILSHYFSIAKRENVDFNATPHGIPFKQPLPPADPPPVDLLIGAKSPSKDNLHQTTPPMKIQASTFRRASRNNFERSKVLSGFRNSNPDMSSTTPPTEISLGSENTDSGTESLPQSPVSSSFPSPSSFRIHKVERKSAPPNANSNTLLQSSASSGHLSMPVSTSGTSGYGLFGSYSDSESSQADSGPTSISPTPLHSHRDSTSSDEQGRPDQDTFSQYGGGQDQMQGVEQGQNQNQNQSQLQSQLSFRGRGQMRGRGMRGSGRGGISVSVGKRMSQSDRLSYDRDEEFEEFEETEMCRPLDGTPTKTTAATITNKTPTEDAPPLTSTTPSSTIIPSDPPLTNDNRSNSSGSVSSVCSSGRGVTMAATTPRRGGVTTVGKRGGGVTLAFTSSRTNNNATNDNNNTPPNSNNNIGGGSLS